MILLLPASYYGFKHTNPLNKLFSTKFHSLTWKERASEKDVGKFESYLMKVHEQPIVTVKNAQLKS